MSNATIAQQDADANTHFNERLSALAALRYYGMISAHEHDRALTVAIESFYPALNK
jgi:hypothetical protein